MVYVNGTPGLPPRRVLGFSLAGPLSGIRPPPLLTPSPAAGPASWRGVCVAPQGAHPEGGLAMGLRVSAPSWTVGPPPGCVTGCTRSRHPHVAVCRNQARPGPGCRLRTRGHGAVVPPCPWASGGPTILSGLLTSACGMPGSLTEP